MFVFCLCLRILFGYVSFVLVNFGIGLKFCVIDLVVNILFVCVMSKGYVVGLVSFFFKCYENVLRWVS